MSILIRRDHYIDLKELLNSIMTNTTEWESIKVMAFWGDYALQTRLDTFNSADRVVTELLTYGQTVNKEDALIALVNELLYRYRYENKTKEVGILERIREDLVGQLA
ncbi:MAG: hypothetical protein ACOYL5_02820 [Phototrophicaceae bacterium]|jgi:stalled ribosome alternative rescue factor ArfA